MNTFKELDPESLRLAQMIELNIRQIHTGSATPMALFQRFGVRSLEEARAQSRAHDGPVWYHGTTVEKAQSIVDRGFVVHSEAGNIGSGVYVGPLWKAIIYGPAVVEVSLQTHLYHWDDPLCRDARRACGYPDSVYSALFSPHALRDVLPAEMMKRGVAAVRNSDPTGDEVCIYDRSAIRMLGWRWARDCLRPIAPENEIAVGVMVLKGWF